MNCRLARVLPGFAAALVCLGLVLPAAPAQGTKAAPVELDPNSLIEPFDPPTLEEIDAKAQWVDQPVQDGMKLLEEQLAKEPALTTPDQALALLNNSDDANKKILTTLGRLPTSPNQVNWDVTINRHLMGDVKSTNPIMQSSKYEFDVIAFVGFGLFTFDWTLRPFADSDSVVSWQTSKDRLYEKIVMRKDLTWSDGKPITAHDIAFSYHTIMNKKVPVLAVRANTEDIRWIAVYDDYTIVMFMKEAMATNVWAVNFPIIPKHIYEKSLKEDYTMQSSDHHVHYENNPVTGGPYTIESKRRGQEIVLARRENFFMHNGKQVRAKPFAKEVRFRIIEDTNAALLAQKRGDLDEMEISPEQWVNQTSGSDYTRLNTKARGTEWLYFYFGWNNKSKFFSDKRVRQAMGLAFDHEEMRRLHYGLYEPCMGIFHPQSWMSPKKQADPLKQDFDKAEELLDAAGWKDSDRDGIRDKVIDGQKTPFDFTIQVANIPERLKICNLLRQNLKQIGINCSVRPLEMTVLFDNLDRKNFDACYAGWGAGTDPDQSENVWATKWIETGRNYLQYSNPEVDRLFAEGKKEFDREKRGAIYARIHELIYEDSPSTFLFHRSSFYGFSKELRGYRFSPRGPFHYAPGQYSFWKVL